MAALKQIDVFNGDADGLCALQQYRLNFPMLAHRVTGVKRDIQLLEKISDYENSQLNVFDISFDSNFEGVRQLLARNNRIIFFDHHSASMRFDHPDLELHCNSDSQTCTSLIVCDYTEARYTDWALVGCYGDGLDQKADQLAKQWGYSQLQCAQFRELGRLLNYNAYGDTLSDLYFSPYALAQQMQHYQSAQDFINSSDVFRVLQQGFASDMQVLADIHPTLQTEKLCLYILPDTASARRLSGTLATKIQQEQAARSVAMLSHIPGGYRISIRSAAPEEKPAALLAQEFMTGGGRAAAAGINLLPVADYAGFSRRFVEYFSQN